MSDQSTPIVKLSIDMKKSRIRLYKSTLHVLGDPPYVQLLVEPSAGVVAIMAVNHYSTSDSIHRIRKTRLLSSNSVEIYSLSFVRTLMSIIPELKEGELYHMTGSLIPTEKVAVFFFSTLKESSEGDS